MWTFVVKWVLKWKENVLEWKNDDFFSTIRKKVIQRRKFHCSTNVFKIPYDYCPFRAYKVPFLSEIDVKESFTVEWRGNWRKIGHFRVYGPTAVVSAQKLETELKFLLPFIWIFSSKIKFHEKCVLLDPDKRCFSKN